MAGEITLVSKDGARVAVSKRGACLSQVVRVALSDDAEAPELTVNLPASVLTRVVDYMRHHQAGEAVWVRWPLRSRELADHCTDPWDVEFMDQGDELELAAAAHYLDVPCLSHLCSAKIATRYWNRSPQQIAKMLNTH